MMARWSGCTGSAWIDCGRPWACCRNGSATGVGAAASRGPWLAMAVWCRGNGRGAQDLEPGWSNPRYRDVGRSRAVATCDRAGNHDDEELARQMVSDASEPAGHVLPRGEASVEARFGGPFRALLVDEGWIAGELWTPLQRDLAKPVKDCGMRVEVIGPERAGVRVAVQRASFDGSTFTDARWLAMASGSPYADARCLVAYDENETAVAAATVWSSGPGRPGLLEPVGVHRGHRGRGYGTAITIAAAFALREMGSSSASVCTRSSNVAAVATYRSAGFDQLSEVPDLSRSADKGGQ